ncbi:MAG: hypothetical protein ACT4TC_14465 [Myxococcaceae bacterium]
MRSAVAVVLLLGLLGCGKSQKDQCVEEVSASCDYSARCSNQTDAVRALCKAQLATGCGETRCALADGGTSGTYSAAKSDECTSGYAKAACGTPPPSCAQVCQE